MSQIECPNCKGKGHVFDSSKIRTGSKINLIVSLFERNNKNGMSRETCEHCKGTGYIEIKGDIKK